MENNYAVDPYRDEEFKTRLNVGEVVIVDYSVMGLNFDRTYVSVVKDIVIDKENNIYTCRLDNFNIDFHLEHQARNYITAATYINIKEDIYAYIHKIEDFEKLIKLKITCNHNKKSLLDIIDNYKVLVEAMKLKEKLNNQ